MRYAMCAFPLIGLVCGGLWCLCGILPLPELARAAAFCLVPVAVTGGIHLDGYADTSDALSSYGDREKKLEILKDSHCGAFAVIRLCCYFAAYFGLCGSVRFTPRAGLCWTLALVLERALSGFAVAAFPLAKDTGLAHTFATAADRQRVRRVLAVLAAAGSAVAQALGGWDVALKVLICFMALDYITGWLVAAVWHKSAKSKTGALDSKASYKGLVKKGENAYNTLSQYLQRPMSLKGCTLEEVLYFVSGSKPVIAMTGNKTGVVIGGYTASKLILYNPQSGKTQTVSRSSYEKIFKDAGNYFISYMSES